jgi:hypothetical protein
MHAKTNIICPKSLVLVEIHGITLTLLANILPISQYHRELGLSVLRGVSEAAARVQWGVLDDEAERHLSTVFWGNLGQILNMSEIEGRRGEPLYGRAGET